MGAKMSKKKKGYCLGAGKDGESTETTEVEQKETENQEGQKDAAEPKGEKTSNDQSQNNGVNEEKQDKKSEEVTSSETTKDDSNKDLKPEVKSSTEQEKNEEKSQSNGKEEPVENKSTVSENVSEDKVKITPEDKPKTEPEVKEIPKENDVKGTSKQEVKEPPPVAADKQTQDSKPAVEHEGADPKRLEEHIVQSSAPALEEEVVKVVLEPSMKAEVEKAEHVVETIAEGCTQAKEFVKEPEKLPDKVGQSDSESIPVEPVSIPTVEATGSEVQCSSVVEPVKIDASQLVMATEVQNLEAPVVPVETLLPESTVPESIFEPARPSPEEPKLVTEPEPVPAPEPVEPTLPEEVPEINVEVVVPEQPADGLLSGDNHKSETVPELMPCPESEKITETTQVQDVLSEPLPPTSNEVPDQTADAQEEPENQECLGCDQGTDIVKTEEAAVENVFAVQQSENTVEQNDSHEPPVIQNRPSMDLADKQDEGQLSSNVVDKGEQKEATEENEDSSTGQERCEIKVCNPATDILKSSNLENDENASQDTNEILQPTLHCNSKDQTKNHEISAEEIKNENDTPAPEILEKHGVGNGLPIKEEIKVHLENGSDNGLHEELHNGQGESHEIQVCNE